MIATPNNRAGFGLIEVLLTIALIGTGIVAIMQLQISASRNTSALIKRHHAITALQNTAAVIRAQPQLDFQALNKSCDDDCPLSTLSQVKSTFTRSVAHAKIDIQCVGQHPCHRYQIIAIWPALNPNPPSCELSNIQKNCLFIFIDV